MFKSLFNKKKDSNNDIILFDGNDNFCYVYGYRSYDFKSNTKVFDTMFITDGNVYNVKKVRDVSLDSNIVNALYSRKIDNLELRSAMFKDANYVIRVCSVLKNTNNGLENVIVDIKVFMKDKNNIDVFHEINNIIKDIMGNSFYIKNNSSYLALADSMYKYKSRIRVK